MKSLNRRSAAVIVFTVLLIAIVNFSLWFFYNKTEQKFDEQLSRRLASIAQLGAGSFGPELVSGMLGSKLWAYDDALDILDQIKDSDSLSEVFVLYSDRKYLATTSAYLNDDSVYYLAALNSATIDSAFKQGNLNALTNGSARPAVTSGYKVGSLLLKSAFVPLLDTNGLVTAVLGVEADVDYTDDLNELKNTLYLASGISVGIAVILGLIFFFLQQRMEASEKSLLISQSQANLGRMVAVVSHEIKNPLMIIRASAESLKKKSETSEAEFIIEETDRLNRIVTGYLDFASGKYNLKPANTEVVELVSAIVQKFVPRLQQRGVKLSMSGEQGPFHVVADPIALRQVVINLILNGAESIENPEGRVDVSIDRDAQAVKISVSDNGVGIDRKKIKEIFEPFYTTKTTGSGLGLFLSKKLVEQMKGSIYFESEKGKGTTAILSFSVTNAGE